MTPVFSRDKWSSISMASGNIDTKSRAASLIFDVAVIT
jgi:hypothetical protein